MSTVTTAHIETLSHEGRGVAKIAGKATFIQDALPGEDVEFIYTRRKGQFDEGKLVKVITPSSQRIAPECMHFGTCGGCSLQHLAMDAQLSHKQHAFLEQLTHIAGISPIELLPPLTAQSWHYRGKARLGVKYVAKKNKVIIGFRERDARFIADLSSCKILTESLHDKFSALSELIFNLEARASIPQIEIAVGDNATALIFRHLQPLSNIDQHQLYEFGKRYSFWIYLQPGGLDSIHQLFPSESESLYYQLPQQNITLHFNPLDFTQVNQSLNQKMITLALELLELNDTDIVLDLFCGLGNFSLPIAQKVKQVIGIEGDDKMVNRANQNAAFNAITNATFYSADLSKPFDEYPWTKLTYSKLVLDPPRTGAAMIVENIKKLSPKRIVYISCNPATFARDAGMLSNQDYRLEKAGIMNMFPHTSHTECIGVFTYTG